MSKKPKKTKRAAPKGEVPEQDPQSAKSAHAGPWRKYSFDVLADDNAKLVTDVRGALEEMRESRKNQPTGFLACADVRRFMIPYRHLAFQWLLDNYGLPEGAMMEMVGAEHLGKSTLLHWIMGGAMLHGVPCALQETENKPLMPDWSRRAMCEHPALAERMLAAIGLFGGVHDVRQMEQNLYDWCEAVRATVSHDTPILMGVDTLSKLLSAQEATGFFDYGENLSAEAKKKFVETNTGSNFDFSKFMQAFVRRAIPFLGSHNASAIFVSHQNVKISMNAPSRFAPDQGALFNKTRRGGKALDQSAAVQLIMAGGPAIKDASGRRIGTEVKVRVDKNSYGTKDRQLTYELYHEGFSDSEFYVQPSLNFGKALCDLLVDKGVFGTVVNRGRYSSKELGLNNMRPDDFSAEVHAKPDWLTEAGRQLKIRGYVELPVEEPAPKVEDEQGPKDQ